MVPMIGRPDEDEFRAHQLTLEDSSISISTSRNVHADSSGARHSSRPDIERRSDRPNGFLLGLSSACYDLGDVDSAVRMRQQSIDAARARKALSPRPTDCVSLPR